MHAANLLLQRLDKFFWWVLVVALGVVLSPPPQVSTGILECKFRLPLQLCVGQRRVRSKVEDVALPTLDDLVGKIATDDFAERLHHVENGGTLASAEIPGFDAGLVFTQVIEGNKVAFGQIEDVYVVADGGSILRRIVCQ